MTEFVLDCFHRDYFLLYIVSTFDEDNVRGHIKLITNLFQTRHARENHTQGKLRDGYTPLTLEECGIVAATLSPVTFLIFKCQFILFRQPSVWRGPNAVLSRGPEEWAAFVGRHKQLRRPRILCGHFLLACFFSQRSGSIIRPLCGLRFLPGMGSGRLQGVAAHQEQFDFCGQNSRPLTPLSLPLCCCAAPEMPRAHVRQRGMSTNSSVKGSTPLCMWFTSAKRRV